MGPLAGVRILEIAGIGPGPFAAMVLADMGADVLRIDRAQNVSPKPGEAPPGDLLNRGRRSVGVDLKKPDGVAVLLKLVEQADALLEGFRPGVMERLGLGPDVCLERNPRLVYGRMTGWGQSGPLAHASGHDINYIALAGTLHGIGRAGEKPLPPLNLVGDFGGGGMLLAFGIVTALFERSRSGRGQVVDAAMVDGAALLMTMMHGFRHLGAWSDERGTNLLDTGSHFYDTYETADGKYVSIGSIEPQFYAELLRLTGLEGEELPRRMDRSSWGFLARRLTEIFKSKTRDEWCWARPTSTPTTSPAAPSSRWPESFSRDPRLVSAGLPQRSRARRPTPASTRMKPWPSGDSPSKTSPASAGRKRSPSGDPTGRGSPDAPKRLLPLAAQPRRDEHCS
jgi:alpha-methylacyl-CoA racemase